MARDFASTFYSSKQWAEVRAYVLKRDNYLCTCCGMPAEEVHHIIHLTPKNINDPSVTMAASNLTSLCHACHFEQHRGEHGKGRAAQEDYPYEFDKNGMLVLKRGTPPV